ncbi:MAG: major capsid protein [Opitutales bacterium]|nr:major capsid protein [Opitutales bacterium]
MSITVNQTLTNYARGVAQDEANSLADFLCPWTPVGVASGQFKSFNDSNAFRVYNTRRPIGGPATRIGFDDTDEFFNCTPHALEAAIDDHEREKAGKGDPLALEQAKIATLIQLARVSHEKNVFDTVANSVSATQNIGNWSSADVDPIEELDSMIEAIALQTGKLPNRIAMSLSAWKMLRNNPKVRSTQPGAAIVKVTTETIAQLLINPAIEIKIGTMGYDPTNRGKTGNKKFIAGNEVYIFIGSDKPNQYDPSFAKAFTSGNSGVDDVREYRDDTASSDIYKTAWSVDVKVTSPISAKRITVS